MRWPWKRKHFKKSSFEYKFLCRHCDVFFTRYDVHDRKCPACHNRMELFEVIEIKED